MDDFAERIEPHRAELRVHCYRMVGSYDEAEDLVQEVFLKAWRGRAGFQARSSLRAWLYRIATNTCLDHLTGRAPRLLPDTVPAGDTAPAWLQPFPTWLWEPVAAPSAEPEAAAVARETLELAFLAAIQHLPPRQRAAVILHDVLGWPARRTAEALDGTAASVNSALQRARATLRDHLPPGRADWAPSAPPTGEDRRVLRSYMAAMEAGDLDALARLLADDVRATMPPFPEWFTGRDAVLAAMRAGDVGEFRMLPAGANGELTAAAYVRSPEDDRFRPFGIGVVRIRDGLIAEITAFHEPALFPAFGLPPHLDR